MRNGVFVIIIENIYDIAVYIASHVFNGIDNTINPDFAANGKKG